MSTDRDVAILGVGMHPWGKWGRDFTEYGMVAARRALDDAGLAWHDIQYVAGADTIRNGYPGLHRRRDVRAEARLDRRARVVELRRVRVGRAGAAPGAGADPRRLLRRRARDRRRHHAQGILRPRRRRAQERPRLAAVPPARRDQPGVLRAVRPPAHGRLRRDQRRLRAGQGEELAARAREPERPVPQGELGRGRAQQPDRRRSAAAARHLRDLRRRRGDDRVEHGLRPEPPRLDRRRAARQGGVHRDAALPADRARAARLRHRLERGRAAARPRFKDSIAGAAYEEAGHRTRRPRAWPRSTTCPPRSSSTGTRTSGCAARARPRRCCVRATTDSAAASR